MAVRSLGRTLVIANPTAHSGRGAQAAERVRRFFESYDSVTTSYEHRLTTAPGDGETMARGAAGYDTVIALGGDGIIHEVVNGLMQIGSESRPALAIVPMGSGNDFARTLNATFNDPEASLREILEGSPRTIELGHVESDVSASAYFMETLSFGLDAAIALDTTDRREANTSQEGETLFATSGVRIMSQVRGEASGFPSRVTIDGEEPLELNSIVFATQNGPTYGGGFSICPKANPTDGLLDLCFNVRTPNVAHLLGLLALARFGRHTGSNVVRLRTFSSLDVEFTEKEPPCQVDGERMRGRHYHVSVVPSALRVIVPPSCTW